MKNERLIRSIGDIADRYIEEAAPHKKSSSQKKKLLRFLPMAACIIISLAATAFAAGYIKSSISSFYLRYLSPQEMALADSMAEQYGPKVYFDALSSDDAYKRYFAINKLVEYYNDKEISARAVREITPFLTDEDERTADAAALALSVLKGELLHPRIIRMADGAVVFTLFNDYSDYGSYNQIWMIKEGELSELMSFDRPKMYITNMLPSPDKRLLAVSLSSNKSSYLLVLDLENNTVGPELVDSARIMAAGDLGYNFWQRTDYENYSGLSGVEWADNSALEFRASLGYDGGEFERTADVRFEFYGRQLEYTIID